jgi:hypothetical protein
VFFTEPSDAIKRRQTDGGLIALRASLSPQPSALWLGLADVARKGLFLKMWDFPKQHSLMHGNGTQNILRQLSKNVIYTAGEKELYFIMMS